MNIRAHCGGGACQALLCQTGQLCGIKAYNTELGKREVSHPDANAILPHTGAPGRRYLGSRYVAFVSIKSEADDAPHELGHILLDRDHLITKPSWYYGEIIMHGGGPLGAAKRWVNTGDSHAPMYMGMLDWSKVEQGKLSAKLQKLERGIVGAVRDRLKGVFRTDGIYEKVVIAAKPPKQLHQFRSLRPNEV